jgi:DNA repair exonuclease SbcCD ATPase subunit
MSNITLSNLQFSNMFSYGKENSLDLNNSRITQLTAPNGSGKSSIAMIIQEILFNKNVKGIKKTDILNRWSKDKQWTGFLEFDIDGASYSVSVQRSGASTKVQLFKAGIDISDHKVLDTYKKIQELLGLNFEIFSQLTYQSSVDLLEFLKATDTNRKKFLINLFNLEKYITIGDKIKVQAQSIDKEFNIQKGELKSVDDFLNSTVIPEKKDFAKVVEIDPSIQQRIGVLEQEVKNYKQTCMKIDKNNMYKDEIAQLTFHSGMKKPEEFKYYDEYQTLKSDLIVLRSQIEADKKSLDDIDLTDVCPSCGQQMDVSHLEKLKEELSEKIQKSQETYDTAMIKASKWSSEITAINNELKIFTQNEETIKKFEQLSQLFDKSISSEYPNIDQINAELDDLNNIYLKQIKKAEEDNRYNESIAAHNAKVDALTEQKNEFLIRQKSLKDSILSKSNKINSLNILKKAFSTSGIVAFKLENLTKELEVSINYYLSLLSDGQFQVEFALDKEKLNISVINNGISTPIETVSGGEFSRIQTSILLAIRSLLSKLGGSSINLLFLDEITGVLDDEGKDKLIEVLQSEHDLNVFLISHDFTHPLIDKISIVKNDNISSIQ